MIETKLGDFEETMLLMTTILGENAYSLRLSREFEAQTGRSISIGAVHSAMERLEEKGFVSSEMGNATEERGGRRKRIFTITALGKRTLKESRDFKISLWQQIPYLSPKQNLSTIFAP